MYLLRSSNIVSFIVLAKQWKCYKSNIMSLNFHPLIGIIIQFNVGDEIQSMEHFMSQPLVARVLRIPIVG